MTNTNETFGAAHDTTGSLEGDALSAWAADRRAAWAFMRAQATLGNSAGYPAQVNGVWTVRVLEAV